MKNEAPSTSLPAQEVAIAEGSRVLHPGVTGRVQRSFEAIQPAKPPHVTLDRAVQFEGQPLALRRATTLRRAAENVPVKVSDGELLVGRSRRLPGLGGTYGEEGYP